VLSADFLKPAGLDSATVARELAAKLRELKARHAHEVIEARLESLINSGLRSLSRSKNFLQDAQVKAAAIALHKEVEAVRQQISGLAAFDGEWALARLRGPADAITKAVSAHDASKLKMSARRAQRLYDAALQVVFEVQQMKHLAAEPAVVRAEDELAELADEFIDVIDALQAGERAS
jgi:hypothetical protein